MATRVTDTLLPTTMVGSYPRPCWYTHQLAGRDVLEAFKSVEHTEAYRDATRAVLGDEEDAGVDVVTDEQMWFDDLRMGIGRSSGTGSSGSPGSVPRWSCTATATARGVATSS